MKRLIPTAILVFCSFNLWAEGAVRVLECSADLLCDAEGNCEAGSGDTVFNMAPIDVGDDGSGSYIISYGDIESEMESRSFAGPFLWNVDGEMHTLLANAETRFLWHRLSLSPTPNASLQFLACQFTQ